MQQFDEELQQRHIDDLHHKEEEALIRTVAPKHGYQYIDLHGITIDADALNLLDEATSRKAEVATFSKKGKLLSITLRNPNNPNITSVFEYLKKKKFQLTIYMSSLNSLEHAWDRYKDIKETEAKKYGVLHVRAESILDYSTKIKSHLDVSTKLIEIENKAGPKRISETIELLFGGALALNASDIHIEPEENAIRLRYRLDGVLWDISNIEKSIYKNLISRFKLLSGLILNITDEAQDGRFTFDANERRLEVRTSIIPGSYGESIVMRVLDPDASGFKLKTLGLNEKLLEIIKKELLRPNGAIITTGPTGSGKTTALYAFMQEVHKPEIKIITIEDPVEYKLKGVVQTQVSDEYTFASGLRAILRQDPDVIMVGEIRDREVAETAVHAALTGHLVFSTLHTNSALGAFPRLIDLGVDARMIGGAFNIILGQRLVRKLCKHCKKERDMTTEEQKLIATIIDRPVAISSIFEAVGCDKCGGSGFRGRIGVYEAVIVDKATEEAVIRDPRESVVAKAAEPQNIPNMQQDGVLKVLSGITSLDELSRVIDLYNTKILASKD